MPPDLEIEVRDYTLAVRAEAIAERVVRAILAPPPTAVPGLWVWCSPMSEPIADVVEALRERGVSDNDMWLAFEDGLDGRMEGDDTSDDGEDIGGAEYGGWGGDLAAGEGALVTPWLRRWSAGGRVYLAFNEGGAFVDKRGR